MEEKKWKKYYPIIYIYIQLSIEDSLWVFITMIKNKGFFKILGIKIQYLWAGKKISMIQSPSQQHSMGENNEAMSQSFDEQKLWLKNNTSNKILFFF